VWSGEGDWSATGKKQPEKKGAVSEKREGGSHSGGFAVALLWGGVQETQKKMSGNGEKKSPANEKKKKSCKEKK